MARLMLQKARKNAGYTQQELAEKLGVSVRTITNWEAGDRSPSLEALVTLAKILGVSTDYLLGNETRPQADAAQPDDIAAHTDSEMSPELKAEIEEIARKVFEKYAKRQ